MKRKKLEKTFTLYGDHFHQNRIKMQRKLNQNILIRRHIIPSKDSIKREVPDKLWNQVYNDVQKAMGDPRKKKQAAVLAAMKLL